MTRDGDRLDVHPREVAIALDKATIVLEFLELAAERRRDALGKAAWSVARDAMARAADAFAEARKVQSNRRDATADRFRDSLRMFFAEERPQPIHYAIKNPRTNRYENSQTPLHERLIKCTDGGVWDGTGSRTIVAELVTCPACSELL